MGIQYSKIANIEYMLIWRQWQGFE